MASKIRKSKNALADAFETTVAHELSTLEQNNSELKAALKDLYITAAKEVDVSATKKAVIIYVPFKLLKSYHKIQVKLTRELEKKFR